MEFNFVRVQLIESAGIIIVISELIFVVHSKKAMNPCTFQIKTKKRQSVSDVPYLVVLIMHQSDILWVAYEVIHLA